MTNVYSFRNRLLRSILVGLLVASIHAALTLFYFSHPPQNDEMFHMLAASSLSKDGTFSVVDGEYRRASAFTRMIAVQTKICGETLQCARILPLAASFMWVFLYTLFVSLLAGNIVGAIAGILLATNPQAIHFAQFVRFYSLHALLFTIVAAATYWISVHWHSMRVASLTTFALLIALLLWFANHLQPLTQIGLLSLVVAAIAVNADRIFHLVAAIGWKQRAGLLVAMTILSIGVLSLIDVQAKIAALRWTPEWARGLENAYLYYYHILDDVWYPSLWPFSPLLILLSLTGGFRPTLFASIVFAICFFFISIAGVKDPRYFIFVLPFLYLPMAWGIKIAVGLLASVLLTSLRNPEIPRFASNRAKALTVYAICGAVAFYLAGQPVARAMLRVVTSPSYEPMVGGYDRYADWHAAVPQLRPLLSTHRTVLASSGVKAAFYFSNFSFALNHTIVAETDTEKDFGMDKRTGRPAVSSASAVEAILTQCSPTVTIVESRHLHDDRHVPTSTVELLDRLGTRVPMPGKNLVVWTSNRPTGDEPGSSDKNEASAKLHCWPLPSEPPTQ